MTKWAWILWNYDWSFYWPIMRKFGSDAFSISDGGTGPAIPDPLCRFPQVSGVGCLGLVLSKENFERVTNRSTLDFPEICCGCGEPASQRISASRHRRFTLREVPICDRCQAQLRDRTAPLLVLTHFESGKLQSIVLVAKSHAFLRETVARNDAGENLPPWFWYDDDDITGMRYAFGPCRRWYDQLCASSDAEREELLQSCPPGWRAWLHLTALKDQSRS